MKISDIVNEGGGGLRRPTTRPTIFEPGWYVGMAGMMTNKKTQMKFTSVKGFPRDGKFPSREAACRAANSPEMQEKLNTFKVDNDPDFMGDPGPEQLLIFYTDGKTRQKEFTADKCKDAKKPATKPVGEPEESPINTDY